MEEIKDYDYIRTKQGTIARIKDTEFNVRFNLAGQLLYEVCICGECFYEEIIKHSKNIIDLIQAGDVLHYKLKGLNCNYYGIVHSIKDLRTLEDKLRVSNYSLEQVEILEILTKEKFESESYKI